MPIDPITATEMAIQVGSNVGSFLVAKKNRKKQEEWAYRQRDWALSDYERQRSDALKDFNMINAYNSPEQQMARYKQAGLNPHLIYGNTSNMPSAKVDNPGINTPKVDAPQMQNGIFERLPMQLSQIMQAQEQMRLQKAQEGLISKQGFLVDAQTLKTLSEGKHSDFDYDIKKQTRDAIIERIYLENENMITDIAGKEINMEVTLDRNDREKIKNAKDVQLTVEKITSERIAQQTARMNQVTIRLQQLYTQAQTDKTRSEITSLEKQRDMIAANMTRLNELNTLAKDQHRLNELQIELRELGIEVGDPWYVRAPARGARATYNAVKK